MELREAANRTRIPHASTSSTTSLLVQALLSVNIMHLKQNNINTITCMQTLALQASIPHASTAGRKNTPSHSPLSSQYHAYQEESTRKAQVDVVSSKAGQALG